jgi:hypothetical protein
VAGRGKRRERKEVACFDPNDVESPFVEPRGAHGERFEKIGGTILSSCCCFLKREFSELSRTPALVQSSFGHVQLRALVGVAMVEPTSPGERRRLMTCEPRFCA